MDFEIDQSRFLAALALARTATAERPSLPVLANVLVQASSEGHVVCSATDTIVSLEVTVPAEVRRPGGLTVAGKFLHEIVKTLSRGRLQAREVDHLALQIASGKTTIRAPGLATSDFPSLPRPSSHLVGVRGSALAGLIASVAFSASTDEDRVNLNSILLEAGKSGTTAVATDGYRMAKCTRAIDGLMLAKAVTLPRSAVQVLGRVLDQYPDQIEVGTDGHRFFVRAPDVLLSMKLTDATFPHQAVIPTSHLHEVYVARESLLSALGRVGLMADGTDRLVRLQLEDHSIVLSADSSSRGIASDEIEAEVDAAGFTSRFNGRFLADALGVIDDDRVRLRFKGELDPCVITPARADDFLAVVMPCRR